MTEETSVWEGREDARHDGWRLEAASTWPGEAVPGHDWVDELTPI
jgi:hypothetical protein